MSQGNEPDPVDRHVVISAAGHRIVWNATSDPDLDARTERINSAIRQWKRLQRIMTELNVDYDTLTKKLPVEMLLAREEWRENKMRSGDEPMLPQPPADDSPMLGGEPRLRYLAETAIAYVSEGTMQRDHAIRVGMEVCEKWLDNRHGDDETNFYVPISFFNHRMECSIYDLHYGLCILMAECEATNDGLIAEWVETNAIIANARRRLEGYRTSLRERTDPRR